jgi:hypothetical protein
VSGEDPVIGEEVHVRARDEDGESLEVVHRGLPPRM